MHLSSCIVDNSLLFFGKSRQYTFASVERSWKRIKVKVPEFLSGIGRGVETHIPKLETAIGDLLKLLVARTLRLKKFGIPCKHRKLILKYSHKYRLGLMET
ncbi:hypothetical protein BRARA_B03576 [Brassica rapa]|uniref:Small ribosomal subunit protein mS41 SAM domain-containing protein n=1 Tax=Brassica campestris TaxID=3711 RepID=A0A398AMQ9_BRACM|nr:hypothetical protein BRARA_B03576 [Brassica rapa]